MTATILTTVIALLITACGASTSQQRAEQRTDPAETQTLQAFSLRDLARMRCSIDDTSAFITWTGQVYSFVVAEQQKKLFKLFGMSATRCFLHSDHLQVTARELTFYLDPVSGELLNVWQNPWTGEELPVVHVANNPVQFKIEQTAPLHVHGPIATSAMDINLTYPSPLAAARFKPYSPQALYQAGEYFRWNFPVRELFDETPFIASVKGSWTRISPWLPWMKMGTRPGHLVFTAEMRRVADLSDVPDFVEILLRDKLSAYQEAPKCWLKKPNVSSWSYFAEHFSAYQAGAIFPLADRQVSEECAHLH